MRRWKTRIGAGLSALLLAALALTPTQAQTDPEADIEDVIEGMLAAWNGADADAFGAFFTDEGIVSLAVSNGAPPETTPEQARAGTADRVGDPPIELIEVKDLTVSGNTGSALLVLNAGGTLTGDHLEFTKVGSEWLVSQYTGNAEAVAPPAGYESVSVEMADYQFNFDSDALAPGDDIALVAENVGNEPHEVVFFKLPQDLDLEAALGSEEEPPVEFLGATFAPPGEQAPAMLVDSLAAGRYAMVCFIETADGTPHWQLGMLADFQVGAEGTPTPTATATATKTATATSTATATAGHTTPVPPKTGSGGLLDGQGDGMSAGMLAVLGLAVLLGASGVYAVRKHS